MSSTRIAIFGDLHGRILLAFWLVKRWQEENESKIDYILCTGDVGVYTDFSRMDKASQRFARKYPEELGFSKFFMNHDTNDKKMLLKPHPIADDIFEDLNCCLYFVAGNHEDHQYIEYIRRYMARDQSAPIAVDVDWDGISAGNYKDDEFYGYERILCIPEGPTVSLDGPLSTETWEPEYHINIRAINGLEKYTNRYAWEAPKPGTVDILLSHETPKGRLKGYDATGRRDLFGSEKLEEFLKRLSPTWHFFGHHHRYYPEARIDSAFGSIQSVGMNQLFFDRNSSKISSGSFGILTTSVSPKTRKLELEFSIVDDLWFEYIYRNHVIHVL